MLKAKVLTFASTIPIFLVLFFAFCCNANDKSDCNPSSCGNIQNISYPFRLKSDPKNCGHPSYELACENNETILELNSNRYHVNAINYHNYSIRVVDPGLKKGNCATVPTHPLPYRGIPPAFLEPGAETALDVDSFSRHNTPATYITCAAPVKAYADMSACYLNTSNLLPLGKYTYVALGMQTTVHDLEVSCSVTNVAWASSRVTVNNWKSITEIHDWLNYGFELIWYRVYCGACEARSGSCYIGSNYVVGCSDYCDIKQPSSLRPTFKCLRQLWLGNYQMLRFLIGVILAARFLFGAPFYYAFLVYKLRRRHFSLFDTIEDFLQSYNKLMPVRYSYSQIRKMTNGFSERLGEGGYGTVYKGKLRSGPLVAVKMMGKSKASAQEFINEVATIGRIHHVNIVQLIGFSAESSKRALIYDFMPNGSLEKYIFSPEEGTAMLSCEKMFDIALGVAKGIEYLHRGCDMQILHFDIKPHNILLDENFIPKLSDFGLAKLYPKDDSIVPLTAARGTVGYMAPELFYKNIGGVSYKADVYSFGMLLMEMAGRRKNFDSLANSTSSQAYFPSLVYDQISKAKELEIGVANEKEMVMVKKMILVALWCIQLRPCDRPSMSRVVEMLEGNLEHLQIPPKPFLLSEDQRPAADHDALNIIVEESPQ